MGTESAAPPSWNAPPPPRTMRNTFLLVKTPTLWPFCHSSQSGLRPQREQTQTKQATSNQKARLSSFQYIRAPMSYLTMWAGPGKAA